MTDVHFDYKLTPRAERILSAVNEEAAQRGHEYIGAEHLFWALMADPRSVPSQVLEKAGCRSAAVEEVERIIATSKPSSLRVNRDGTVVDRS